MFYILWSLGCVVSPSSDLLTYEVGSCPTSAVVTCHFMILHSLNLIQIVYHRTVCIWNNQTEIPVTARHLISRIHPQFGTKLGWDRVCSEIRTRILFTAIALSSWGRHGYHEQRPSAVQAAQLPYYTTPSRQREAPERRSAAVLAYATIG
ncbi:hypothetical protein EDD15DRAFT_2311407 [Pisolithus albus]|nr:hypothetical protein EDD15DRAFT_2311407 [Pisolithus albus]